MDMQRETEITLVWELFKQGVPKTHISKQLGRNRDTILQWIQGIEQSGLLEFLQRYENAKKGERQKRKVTSLIKHLVWDIRRNEYDCCGQKIQYYLRERHEIHLSVQTIYEILNEKFEIKSKWKKGTVIKGEAPTAENKREVVQMDTINFGEIFAFTAVDIVGKDADVFMAPALTGEYGAQFLEFSMPRRFDGYTKIIQTDGGSEFKEKFAENVLKYCERRRVARAYKKNEQSYIESFNRTVRKECLGWQKYRYEQLEECQKMVESFLERYHYQRPHMSLGMQPPLKLQNNRLPDF